MNRFFEKNRIKRGVRLVSVANSDFRQGSAVSGANPTLLETKTSPLYNKISSQEDIVKREKKKSDQIPLSIQTEKIQRHKKSAEKSGNSPKSYAIDGVIRKIAKQRIR